MGKKEKSPLLYFYGYVELGTRSESWNGAI